jgi:hypothetical protein
MAWTYSGGASRLVFIRLRCAFSYTKGLGMSDKSIQVDSISGGFIITAQAHEDEAWERSVAVDPEVALRRVAKFLGVDVRNVFAPTEDSPEQPSYKHPEKDTFNLSEEVFPKGGDTKLPDSPTEETIQAAVSEVTPSTPEEIETFRGGAHFSSPFNNKL